MLTNEINADFSLVNARCTLMATFEFSVIACNWVVYVLKFIGELFPDSRWDAYSLSNALSKVTTSALTWNCSMCHTVDVFAVLKSFVKTLPTDGHIMQSDMLFTTSNSKVIGQYLIGRNPDL